MASTFRLNSHSYQGRYMYLSCTQTRAVETNDSLVDWTLTTTGGSSAYYTTGPTTVKINGETVYHKEKVQWYDYIFPAKKGSKSGTITVKHDNNGDASVEVSITTNIYNGVLITTKDTWVLDSNERFATLKAAPNFNDEENPVIEYTNPAGDIVTELQACISLDGSKDTIAYRDIPKDGKKYTFALTDAERDALRSAIPNDNSKKLQFIVRSVIAGTTGYSSLKRTFTVKNPSPVIAPKITDINSNTVALTGDNSKLVRYCSNASITIGATAVKKATLKSQEVTCGSNKLTADGTINAVSSNTFVFTATDSRENTTTKTVTPTLIKYIKPTCILEDNIPDATGSMSLKATGNYFNGTFGAKGNSLEVYYRYKPAGGTYSGWVSMTVTLDGNTYSATSEIAGLDYKVAYVFQVYAKDALKTVYSAEKRVKASPVFDWSEDDFRFHVPVSLSGNRLSELEDPVEATDAVNLGYARSAFAPAGEYQNKCITVTAAGTDLNDYLEEGTWYFGTDYTPENAPADVTNGFLRVMRRKSSSRILAKQIWYRQSPLGKNAQETYVRTYDSAYYWTDWSQYITEKEALIKKKLWTNANLANSFSAQTLSIDLSGYDGVEILYYVDASTNVYQNTGTILKGRNSVLWYVTATSGHRLHREFTATDDGVEFGTATNYSGSATADKICIPYIIYGVKGGS